MPPVLSLIVPSRRPDQLTGLLDNIEEMTADFDNVEVVVKVDDDVEDAAEIMAREQEKRPYTIRFVCTPRHGGVFTLWAGQHEAFEASNPESYFCIFASDEIRFLTKNWDVVLSRYVGWFPDHIFRLRPSDCKYRNYHELFDCTFMPESFAIITRRWLEVAEGTGHCWGTDAFHQCVAFHLSLGAGGYSNVWHHRGLWRDVQIHDVELGGMEFGKDITAREHFARNLRIFREWNRLCNYSAQLRFAYLARRLSLYCYAVEKGIQSFTLVDDRPNKRVNLIDMDSGEVVARERYRLSRTRVFLNNTLRNIRLAPGRFRWAVQVRLSILVYPKSEFSKPLMTPTELGQHIAKKFRWARFSLEVIHVGRRTDIPPAGSIKYYTFGEYLVLRCLIGPLRAVEAKTGINRLLQIPLLTFVAISLAAGKWLSSPSDVRRIGNRHRWFRLIRKVEPRVARLGLTWFISARAREPGVILRPHRLRHYIWQSFRRIAGRIRNRIYGVFDAVLYPLGQALHPPAPGLEPPWDVSVFGVNRMMKRINYPVADTDRLRESYASLTATERDLACRVFGNPVIQDAAGTNIQTVDAGPGTAKESER